METIVFIPVSVSRGRLFRGHGYLIGDGGVSGNWAYTIYKARIWDPMSKMVVYANMEYVDKDLSRQPNEIEADKQAYIQSLVDDTVAYCRSKSSSPDSPDTKQWIRNSLLKKLPKDIVDKLYPDQRSVADEVEKTIRWAATLVSRPTFMYGKQCEGGKPYSRTRKAEIAYKQLRKKGFTSKPEFEACWMMWTSIFDFPDVREKVEKKIAEAKRTSYDEYYATDYA